MRRLQASSMKCAPFCDDSAKRTPWFARIADRIALDAGEAADERLAVELLELVEARAVDDAADHRARVELVPEVLGNEAVQIRRVERGLLHRGELPRGRGRGIEVADDLARDRERVLVRGRVVVGDARAPRVDVRAAELLRGDVLSRRGLHERRAADEDRPGPASRSRSRPTSPGRTRRRRCRSPSRPRSAGSRAPRAAPG